MELKISIVTCSDTRDLPQDEAGAALEELIEAQGWSDYTVDYTQIDSISYEENLLQNSNDYRTNGLGNFKYAMGNFRNDVYGNYIRYTHSSCHSYVVMSVDGKILVINGENDSATEEIYHTISEKMSRELE